MESAEIEAREAALTARFAEAKRLGCRLRVVGRGQRTRSAEASSAVQTISLATWDQVVGYQPADLMVTVEAGMSLSALNRRLADAGQWIPMTAADGLDDTVGGAVAAGLDGIWRGGYGPLRDRVLGLRVLTPGFGAIQVGAHVVKNVAGYNLPRLFIGSRGAMGVIVRVTLKVSPMPPVRRAWVWEGEWDVLTRQADRLLAWAAPWASILLVREPGWDTGRLWAEWHGIYETVEFLQEQAGPGMERLPWWRPPGWSAREVTLKGAVPRRVIGELVRAWEDGPLAVEWQTGFFWGALSLGGARRIMRWIRERSGGVDVVSGPETETTDLPAALQGPWQRLKTAYDPDAILV